MPATAVPGFGTAGTRAAARTPRGEGRPSFDGERAERAFSYGLDLCPGSGATLGPGKGGPGETGFGGFPGREVSA